MVSQNVHCEGWTLHTSAGTLIPRTGKGFHCHHGHWKGRLPESGVAGIAMSGKSYLKDLL